MAYEPERDYTKRLGERLAAAEKRVAELEANLREAQHMLRQLLAAYNAEDRDIPDSDLDNEQPLTLNVRLTLGDIRAARRQMPLTPAPQTHPEASPGNPPVRPHTSD